MCPCHSTRRHDPFKVHKIKRRDTPESISRLYNMSIEEFAACNTVNDVPESSNEHTNAHNTQEAYKNMTTHPIVPGVHPAQRGIRSDEKVRLRECLHVHTCIVPWRYSMPLAFMGLNRTSYVCLEFEYAHQVTSRSQHAMLMLGVTRSLCDVLMVWWFPGCVDGPIILSRIGGDEIVHYGIPLHYIPTVRIRYGYYLFEDRVMELRVMFLHS